MLDYALECELYEQGYQFVCGVDEAGRGPLCGPVVAAAVILPKDTVIEGLDDSKKLTEKKREKLFEVIKEKAIAYAIAFSFITSKSASRFFSVSFFESLSPGISHPTGRITAAATTGPHSGPRPASSHPHTAV